MESALPFAPPPINWEADAKDRLRDAGIITGPDRYGNWFVPCGDENITDWRMGDPITTRVLVRNNGVLQEGEHGIYFDWIAERWARGPCSLPEHEDGTPLPFIY